jgi:hypothetical protein
VIRLGGVTVRRVCIPDLAHRLVYAGDNETASKILMASARQQDVDLTRAECAQIVAVLQSHCPADLVELRVALEDMVRQERVRVKTEQQVYSVLLLRKTGDALNDGFEYWAEELPAVGDEIELALPADFRPHSNEQTLVRAVVTGIERDKHSPIRAREL